MTVGTTDRMKIGSVEETAFGELPVTPELAEKRLNSESFTADTDTTQSPELDSGRQRRWLKRTGLQTSGTIEADLAMGAHDDWMTAAIGSAGFSTPPSSNTGTFSAAESTSELTGTGIDQNVSVGDWVKLLNFSATLDATPRKVMAVSSDTLTVFPKLEEDVTGSGSESITFFAIAENGTAKRSFAIEKQYTDLDSVVYSLFTGQTIDTWSVTVDTEDIITQSFDFQGKLESQSASTVDNDGSYNDKSENEPMSSVEDVFNVFLAPRSGAATNANAEHPTTSLGWETANSLRMRKEIGTLGPVSIGQGKAGITGSLVSYFRDKTVRDYYLNFTDGLQLAFMTQDADGAWYIFDFPRIKFTSGPATAQGEEQDILNDLSFTALKDETEEITMRIAKFDPNS